MVKEIKSLNKEKSKVELELESVEKSVIKAQNNITNAEDKCQHFQECMYCLTHVLLSFVNYFRQ